MPIDTIGNIDLQLAEREASAVEKESQALRGLGGAVGSSLKGALDGAEVLQKQAIDEQKTKEADAILKSGAQGINQYVQELNANGANLDPNVYNNMASTVKTPEGYKPIYVLARKTADKNASDARRTSILGNVQGEIESLGENPTIDQITNLETRLSSIQADPHTDKDTSKQIDSVIGNLGKKRASLERKKTIGAGKLVDKYGRQIPTIQQDEKTVREVQKSMSFGNRGGQKVLGVAINKQTAIQDALDTISGIDEGEFKATQQIGQEIASIIAQVLSTGGSTTESDRKSMFPNSWAGTINNQIQEIKGKPMDAIPEKLLGQLKHMLEREKNFWDSRISDVNKELAGMLDNVLNREAVSNGKSTRVNREMKERFVKWLFSLDKSRKSISSRIGKERGDIADLILSDEEKAKLSDARKSYVEFKSGDVVSGTPEESSAPASTSTVAKKEPIAPATISVEDRRASLDKKKQRLAELKAQQGAK